MIDRLKIRLGSDNPTTICWSVLRDPQLVRSLAGQDFDAILLDAQHGFHAEDSILDCIQPIVSLGKSPMVRIPVGRWDMVERALDFGALSVVAPMINTQADALAFARAAKYPGAGERSYGPAYAASLYGISSSEYLKAANQATVALAQIETREAYDNLDVILDVEGIDGVLMGPGDFSISMTGEIVPDSYGAGTIDAIADIAKRTKAKGKVAAAFTNHPEHSHMVQKLGYQLISLMIDQNIAELGAQKVFEDFRG